MKTFTFCLHSACISVIQFQASDAGVYMVCSKYNEKCEFVLVDNMLINALTSRSGVQGNIASVRPRAF